jgi:hypothetical protein
VRAAASGSGGVVGAGAAGDAAVVGVLVGVTVSVHAAATIVTAIQVSASAIRFIRQFLPTVVFV